MAQEQEVEGSSKFTLVGLAFCSIVSWLMFKIAHKCSYGFLVLGHNSLQKDMTKSWWEGHLNGLERQWCKAKTGELHNRRALTPCLAADVNTSPGGYWPTLSSWKIALPLEYLSDFLCGYCLGVCVSACKRISLDYNYFMLIFKLKVGMFDKNLELAVRLTVIKRR